MSMIRRINIQASPTPVMFVVNGETPEAEAYADNYVLRADSTTHTADEDPSE